MKSMPSKTQRALAHLSEHPGETIYSVAKQFEMSPTTLYTSIARQRQRGVVHHCPACGSLTNTPIPMPNHDCGAEVSAAVVADRRRIALVLAASVQHAGAETLAGKAYQAIADRIAGMPLYT